MTTDSKLFIYLLSQRRNFIPILSIFFLTLDNTNANQIWIFTALWFIGALIFEMPSWYFSDRFWHKKTLIMSKLLETFSVIFYVLWAFCPSPYNFYVFTIWSILQSVWFAFSSGATSAFYHEILESKWEGKKYANKFWKLHANVSLASLVLIAILPFFVSISYLVPLLFWIAFDIVWLIFLLLIPDPKVEYDEEDSKTIAELFSDMKWSSFVFLAIFFSLIAWFFFADSPYRWPYLIELWFPVAFIWFMMAFSRLVWFGVWHSIHILERIFDLKKLMIFELIFFPSVFISISQTNNPYIVWLLFSLAMWYKWGRWPLINWFMLNDYIKNKKYKATFLSLESLITSIIWIIITLVKWRIILEYGYTTSYFIVWCLLFVLLSLSLLFLIYRKIY